MSPILGIFAKQPIAGQVKTRLAAGMSPDFAQRVAQACLDDWLDRLLQVDARRVIAYAPASAESYFARLGYELRSQGEGDLGVRLRRFFDTFARPRQKIVVVGSDSPTVPTAFIEQAFRELDEHEVVIGPSCDGGYYLIGAYQAGSLFDAIAWSTSSVLEASLARLANSRLALLPPWYDIDTVEDWAMLRGHVCAMRQAGIDPQVPRLECLIQEQSP